MDEVKIIEIKQGIFKENEMNADDLREYLKNKGVFLLNVMASPGSGKTTTIIRLIEELKSSINIAVMEADIDSDVDAIKIMESCGVTAIQLHTGGMCHLDSKMTRQGLDNLDLDNLDLVILENVGNLVCPAEFDTGSVRNLGILSVPEGDDKPLKYPLMFSVCDAIAINKIDTLMCFDFNLDNVNRYIKNLNDKSQIFHISAKNNTGIKDLSNWLLNEIKIWKK